ncbi:peptide deformylase [Candidatus Saccharibacteria bacterium]|nr:peptide deformylase [Candidatus Saccharibacteria bacterium]
MKKEDIITLPNPRLRERSQKVGVISAEIVEHIEGMKNATLDWEDNREHEVGVALASVQVNSLLRIIVVRNDFDNKKDRTFQVFINPEIVKLEGKQIEDYEGCLSIRDIYGKVPRYEKVKIKAIGEDGQPVRITAEGFLARIFQHEIDHTNGIVFIDHIKDQSTAFFKLDSDGHLVELDYENDVRNNSILW